MGGPSINQCTPPHLCKVKYFDLDHAVQNSLYWMMEANVLKRRNRKGHENQHLQPLVYYSKTDFRSAFRVLPLNRQSWLKLVIKAKEPISNETYFFVDKSLPFGASISCSHFQ